MEKSEIRLGQRVTFAAGDRLTRMGAQIVDTRGQYHHGKRWQSMNGVLGYPVVLGRAAHHGIVIGTRTVQNGYSVHHYEEPSEWVPVEYVDVVLVAENLRSEPTRVLAKDLTLEDA